MNIFSAPRKSSLELGAIYFWTATIRRWKLLLIDDKFKQIIIDSIIYLTDRKLIDVFGFVIMPNHVHLIWRLNKLNGKELPSASFLKFTAHEFKKRLKGNDLSDYHVAAVNKEFEFWQRDSLAMNFTVLKLHTKNSSTFITILYPSDGI